MNYYWAMLKIAPTNDLKVIKRAYATQLKAHRPEDNAEHFQRLREAYEWACQIGVHCLNDDEEEDDYDDDDDAYDDDEHREVKLELATAELNEPKNDEVKHVLTQALSELALILPSVPTHFPLSFEPAPSPSMPLLTPNAPANADKPDVHPFLDSPRPEFVAPAASVPNIAYALSTEQSGRRRRTVAQVLAAFWTQSQQLKTIPEIQAWLQTQAEYESLQTRPKLEAALADAFVEEAWPWPAVLAVAELLDWGTIGNLIGGALNQAVQLAHLQQRSAITRKPRWRNLLSKSAAAYFLLSPFSWPKTLFSALLPRTQQIDALYDEVDRTGVDPAQVFNFRQIEFQRQLRQLDFNLPRLSYAIARCISWPLLFSLLFLGVDLVAPLVGLAFGLTCFALWAGYVANRLLFRAFWTPRPAGAQGKTFWLSFGVTFAVACISMALASPTVALVLSGFLLFAVAQNFLVTLGSGALGSFISLIISAALWPTKANEQFGLVLPLVLCFISLCLYFYQRRIPSDKLLNTLRKPPTLLKPVAAPIAGNFNWWWIIAGIALMRLFAAGH